MNTRQLECVIQCDCVLRKRVVGVFALDELLSISTKHYSYPCGLIVNTQPSSEDGGHWISIYADKRTVELYDSFGSQGLAYNLPNIKRFVNILCDVGIGLKRSVKPVEKNSIKLQSDSSLVCGQYCLYYLLHRLRGLSMNDVNKIFDAKNSTVNDEFVYRYILERYPYCLSNKKD